MAVLLAVVVVRAVLAEPGPGREAATVGVAVAMALVYAAGLGRLVGRDRARALAWLVLLVGCWVALVVLTPQSVFLAFPLYFLIAHVLPDRSAVAAVGVLTAVAVLGYALPEGWSFAAVLGPVLGALVAIATVLGIRAVDRESQRRGVLEERERLAREIHDTLAQGLSSIQLLLGAAEQQLAPGVPARDLVWQARQVATGNLEETRRFVRALTPAALADQSLGAGLDRLAATHRASLTVDGRVRALPPAYDEALLRIAQEALTNAGRHAAADHVAVTLGYLADSVSLDVVDDGLGFDPAAHHEGFGLRSMRSRAEQLRGSLTVESAPGGGTAIGVSLPEVRP